MREGRTAAGSICDAVLHFCGHAKQLSSTIKYTGTFVEKSGILCHSRFEVHTDIRVCGYQLARALEALVAAAESAAAQVLHIMQSVYMYAAKKTRDSKPKRRWCGVVLRKGRKRERGWWC